MSNSQNKSMGVAYFLWFLSFLGFAGLNRMYCGRWISGFIWFFTWGILGVGILIDLFWTAVMVEDCNGGFDDETEPSQTNTVIKEVHHHYHNKDE